MRVLLPNRERVRRRRHLRAAPPCGTMRAVERGGAVLVGVISDTHGYLDPRAPAALRSAELILHAGDVGGQPILDGLGAIAPVHAVAGNTDAGTPLGRSLPEDRKSVVEGKRVDLGGRRI